MSQPYASERDRWLVVIGLGATALSVVSVAPLLLTNIAASIKLVTGTLLILTVALVIWVYVATYYVVEAGELLIRSGPFRWRIHISEIHRISSTRSPWSSPALSLNRLRLDYGDGKWILLSPKRREVTWSSYLVHPS